ncbi:FHIPEP family type III secretion protein, partial [Pseudomonas sp. 5S3]
QNQIMYKQSHDQIRHQKEHKIIQMLAKGTPKLAEEKFQGILSLSALLKVLQALLAEQGPVRDIRSIAEAIAIAAPRSQVTAALGAAVRIA